MFYFHTNLAWHFYKYLFDIDIYEHNKYHSKNMMMQIYDNYHSKIMMMQIYDYITCWIQSWCLTYVS